MRGLIFAGESHSNYEETATIPSFTDESEELMDTETTEEPARACNYFLVLRMSRERNPMYRCIVFTDR